MKWYVKNNLDFYWNSKDGWRKEVKKKFDTPRQAMIDLISYNVDFSCNIEILQDSN